MSADALDLLTRHRWPGNIRELRNALEQATLMTDDLLLTAANFASLLADPRADDRIRGIVAARPAIRRVEAPEPGTGITSRRAAVKPLAEAVAELEGRAIREAMAATGGNKLAASRLLGIARATLYDKLALAQRAGGVPPAPGG